MIKLYKIIFVVVLLSFAAFAQTEVNQDISKTDSIIIQTNPLLELNYKFDEFEFIRDLNSVDHLVVLDENDRAAWLKTKLLINNTNLQNNFEQPHFTSQLYRQYLADQEFSPVRYVLGMAQLGAVGYLAYKHIKKYGFLYD